MHARLLKLLEPIPKTIISSEIQYLRAFSKNSQMACLQRHFKLHSSKAPFGVSTVKSDSLVLVLRGLLDTERIQINAEFCSGLAFTNKEE